MGTTALSAVRYEIGWFGLTLIGTRLPDVSLTTVGYEVDDFGVRAEPWRRLDEPDGVRVPDPAGTAGRWQERLLDKTAIMHSRQIVGIYK